MMNCISYANKLLGLGVFFLPAVFGTLATASSTVTVTVHNCVDSHHSVKVNLGEVYQGPLGKGASEDYSCDTKCHFDFEKGSTSVDYGSTSGTVYVHVKSNDDITVTDSGSNCGSEG